MDLSTISSTVINSNVSVQAFEVSPTGRHSTSSPDDTINNDFYYDDEFTVQFDANITDLVAVDQEMTSPMVQSLNDVSSVPDNRRMFWMTSSRSDSCLVARSHIGNSYDEGEDMSTSERQDDMLSSSDDGDVSDDVQTSVDRPLFTPPPSTVNSPFREITAAACSDSDAVGAESACSSMVLDGAVYDFTAAKKQYVLSFDVRNTSSRLSSSGGGAGDEFMRASLERSGAPLRSNASLKTRDRKKAVTVGCNGAGLTTWKQVRGLAEHLPQQPDTGFTTWQRLKATRGKVPAYRSTTDSIVADDDDVTSRNRVDESDCQMTSRDHTGHLLKLYCSARNNLGSSEYGTPVVTNGSARCGTPFGGGVGGDTVKRQGMTSFVVQASSERHPVQAKSSGQVNKKSTEVDSAPIRGKSAEREISGRDRRRTHRKSFADRSIQCLPPSVTDRSVQTSIEQPRGACRQSLLSTANKSLQTSSSSHVSHMERSAVLLSRPLPDLDFLRTGLQPTSQQPTNDLPTSKDAFQARQAAERKAEGVDSVSRRTRSSHPGDQAARVRRHHSSDSAFSNNSSSSSGIEPGYYDSSSHADRTSTEAVPRKPPRLFQKVASLDDKLSKTDVEPMMRDSMDGGKQPTMSTRSCISQFDSRQSVVQNGVLSDKMAADVSQRNTTLSSLRDSLKADTSLTNQNRDTSAPMRLTSPRRSRRRDAAQSPAAGSVTTTSVSSSQTTVMSSAANSKPAKSILRRQRQKNKSTKQQSSWSDNHDSDKDDTSCCHSDDVIEPPCVQTVIRRSERPLSLPDAAVLFMNAAKRDAPEIGVRREAAKQQTGDGASDVNNVEDCEQFRAKKSVSFSEKIFYHSMPPSVSPIESPLCPNRSSLSSSTSSIDDKSRQCAPSGDVIKACVEQVIEQQRAQTATNDVSKIQRLPSEDEDSDDLPPSDFTVSPPSSSPTTMSLMTSFDAVDLSHKKDLVLEVMRAVEALTNYFRREQDAGVKVRLGNSVENEEVGRLVIDQLCPALHAILLDGLNPHVRSFFGRVKNSAWKVVEDSVELGEPVELLSDLLGTVRSLKFLRTPWLLFNAFIISLLNVKALDFWLSHLYGHKLLMAQHYSSSAFLALSGSGVAAHRLFMDLITAVQPLSQLPFWIEFDFELRTLERNRYRMLCSSSVEQTDSMAAATSKPRRPSSVALQDVDVSQTLRTAFHRIGNRATQSLVLAKNALQNTPPVAATGGLRRPRPLSMPINLADDLTGFGSGQSQGGSQDVGFESSSGDSVDSSGFFRRFAGQFWPTSSPRSAVYRRGVTDYSFRQEESPQSDMTPVREDVPDEHTPEQVRPQQSPSSSSPSQDFRLAGSDSLPRTISTESNPSRSSTLTRHKTSSNVNRSSMDSSSGAISRSKRWSDFGTRLVGFVDKVLLPVEPRPQRPMSIDGVNKYSSDGKLNACTFTAPVSTVADQSRCEKSGQGLSYDVRMQRNIFNSVGGHVTATTTTATSLVPVDRKPEVKFATTLCHCVASEDDQLSFRKGTQLMVVCDMRGSDWLLCRHGDQEGLVHRACVKTAISSPNDSDDSNTF